MLAAGDAIAGLYILVKGKVAFEKGGKAFAGVAGLSTGQYFGEAALCTAQVS